MYGHLGSCVPEPRLSPLTPDPHVERKGSSPAQHRVQLCLLCTSLTLPDQAATRGEPWVLPFLLVLMHLKGKVVSVEDPGRFSLADDLVGPPFADTLKKTNPHPDHSACVCSEPCFGNLRSEAVALGTGTVGTVRCSQGP